MTVSKISPGLKTVLITGCSEGGIGAALAFAFLETGKYHVFATARNLSKLPAKFASSPSVTALPLDVVSADSIAKAAEAVAEATGGKLDVLVNNGGVALMASPLLDTDIQKARALFDVNFFGVIAVTQTFAPLLIRAHGAVVNNSSIAGVLPLPYQSMYNSSKAALTMLGEILRPELSPLGVRVITLLTGAIASNIVAHSQPDEIKETSYYWPIRTWLKKQADGAQMEKTTPTAEYARDVVAAIEAGRTGKVWIGYFSGLAKLLTGWAPVWLMDRIFASQGPPNPEALARGAENRPDI